MKTLPELLLLFGIAIVTMIARKNNGEKVYQEISEKATDLITLAKEKSEPVIAEATKDLKKNLSEFLADLSEKLED